jgi:hypothetical protein
MRFSSRILTALLLFFLAGKAIAQDLKPGFIKEEYIELLKVSSEQGDSVIVDGPNYLGPVSDYIRIYRSPEVGLMNRWDLWKSKKDNTLVISLRGTVKSAASWMENFYSAMIPAIGKIQLNDSTSFEYHYANDPKATVHTGWALGMAYMAPDIFTKLKEHQAKGTLKNVYIMGHSQGGALGYLLNSYLRYKIETGELPKDLKIKTYCSAAPKPGNLYYAYEYDFNNRGGWAFNIVNAADWVPEAPFSIQTTDDFNDLNPFKGIKKALKGVKPFYVRWYLNNAYNKLHNSAKNTQDKYRKYLGTILFKMVHDNLPDLKEPDYAASLNYMRAGQAIILMPDAEYYAIYPNATENIFMHHNMKAYLYLMEKQY